MIAEVEQLLKRTIGEQIDLVTRVEGDTWPRPGRTQASWSGC